MRVTVNGRETVTDKHIKIHQLISERPQSLLICNKIEGKTELEEKTLFCIISYIVHAFEGNIPFFTFLPLNIHNIKDI